MLLGPIFRVEMVSVARRRRYFVLRVIYAALILFVLWATYSSSRYLVLGTGQQSIRQSAMLAASFFMSFSWLQMLAILFVGPAMAVGTIATERERRTIEYLFATDLSNAEIVLGKTFARLTLLGQFVLVGLPILFLFRLMGGIPAEALLAIFLSAAGTALMLTGLSIAVSVWSPRARDATVRIYLLLFVLFTLPAILYGFHGVNIISDAAWQAVFEPLTNALMLINPISTLTNAMGNTSALGFGLDMRQILEAVSSQLLVTIASLFLSVFAVRRVHLTETTKSAVKRAKLQVPSFRRPLGAHPMRWKEMFSSTSATAWGRIGWLALFVILLSVLICTFWVFALSFSANRESERNDYNQYLVALTGYLGCGMLLLLAARSAGLVSQEKERDTWLSLLSTPLSGREIIGGKMWGNLFSARWMFVILITAWALGLLIDPHTIWPLLVTCATFFLIACYATSLGLFFSLRSPTTLRAMGLTLGTLVFAGGGYMFCCCVVMSTGMGSRDWEIILFLCIPLLLMFPGITYEQINEVYFWKGGMHYAYFLGLLCYLVVAAGLYAHMVSYFDKYAGRTGSKPSGNRFEANT
jgi:ABC-type transport system involved in multi-copper enzyme maturation permease subunit